MTGRLLRALKSRGCIGIALSLLMVSFPVSGMRSGVPARADIRFRIRQPDTIRTENAVQPGTNFKSLPIRFELNTGQTDSQVRFTADTQNGVMFLTPNELVMKVFEPAKHITAKERRRSPEANNKAPNSSVVHLRTVNANPDVRITGIDPLPGTTNYFLGNDPKNWHTNVPSFAKVKYENVYPGIDLIYYGNEGNLEYDFNVAPGADPKQIALSVDGADKVDMDEAGNLLLHTAVGIVSQHAPRIYQADQAGRHEVPGGYVMRPDGLLAFDLVSYDRGKPLVIDPEVVYSTYFGGSMETDIGGITVDPSGSVYVVGDTYAHDFPTQNPIQGTNNHSQNFSAIISKFSPDGQSLVYSTYLGGGGSGADFGLGIVVDSTNAAYITGITNSTDFPTVNPIQSTFGGGVENLFISKISPDGSTLVYSTYLGGSGIDVPYGITLDLSNNAYVYGSTTSTNFPTVNPTQADFGSGSMDGFLSAISSDGSPKLGFSTYLGSGGQSYIDSLMVVSGSNQADVYFSQPPSSSSDTSISHDDTEPPTCFIIYWHWTFNAVLLGLIPSVITLDKVQTECNSTDGGESFVRVPDVWNYGGISHVSPAQAETIQTFFYGGCVPATGGTTCSGYASLITLDPSTVNVDSAQNISAPIAPSSGSVNDPQGAAYITGSQPTSSAFPLVNPVQPAGGGTSGPARPRSSAAAACRSGAP